MGRRKRRYESALGRPNQAVAEAMAYFASADEALSDGHQTARQVLAHLVFWHREYASIARAVASGREPALRVGGIAELNAEACREFEREPLSARAAQLASFQRALDRALGRLPHWRMDFPARLNGRPCSVEQRVPAIEAHIRAHLAALRRAARERAAGREALADEPA